MAITGDHACDLVPSLLTKHNYEFVNNQHNSLHFPTQVIQYNWYIQVLSLCGTSQANCVGLIL